LSTGSSSWSRRLVTPPTPTSRATRSSRAKLRPSPKSSGGIYRWFFSYLVVGVFLLGLYKSALV
jgi:hypothetical protein